MGGCTAFPEQTMTGKSAFSIPQFQKENCEKELKSQLLDIYIECFELPEAGVRNTADPLAVLWILGRDTKWRKVGRTEIIYDSKNPKFANPISAQFAFEEIQTMKMEIYSIDDASKCDKLEKQELLGSVEFFLHKLLRSKDQTLFLNLLKITGKGAGKLKLTAEPSKDRLSSDLAKMQIEASSIKKNAKLFFKIFREEEETKFVQIYQSEVFRGVRGVYNWIPIKLSAARFFCDDLDLPLHIELFEDNPNGKQELLDTTEFTFRKMQDNFIWKVNVGEVKFKNAEIVHRSSFLDYLRGGLNISLSVAIDFTTSNGHPLDRSSLHFSDPYTTFLLLKILLFIN